MTCTKREFMIDFVLNRATAGGITSSGHIWANEANAAWNRIDFHAPELPTPVEYADEAYT